MNTRLVIHRIDGALAFPICMLLVLFLLTSCSHTVVESDRAVDGSVKNGITYSTPVQLVRLRLEEKQDAAGNPFLQSTLSLPPAVPDRQHTFRAELEHRWNFENDLTIDTTASGLLESVSLGQVDKSGAILVAAAKAVKEAFKLGVQITEMSKPAGIPEVPFEATFDPTKPAEISDLNRILNGALHLTSEPLGSAPPVATAPQDAAGIVTRRPVPYLIALRRNADPAGGPVEPSITQLIAMVPQAGDFQILELDGAAFQDSTFGIHFEDGLPSKLHVKKTSQGHGVASVLPDVLKEIVAIPGELIQLKIDTTKDDKALVEAREALLEAQLSLESAIRDLSDNSSDPAP